MQKGDKAADRKAANARKGRKEARPDRGFLFRCRSMCWAVAVAASAVRATPSACLGTFCVRRVRVRGQKAAYGVLRVNKSQQLKLR